MRLHIPLLLLVMLGGVSTTAARDIFVSNLSGNDLSNGRSTMASSDGSGPVRTIARALRIAQPGDYIFLDGTDIPYRESLSLTGARGSGRPSAPLVIVGNGATLDGSVPVPDALWQHYRGYVFRFRPRRQTYLQLFLENRPLVQKRPVTGSLAPPRLEPLEWCLFDTYVYFRVERGKVPADYQLTQTGHAAAITLFGAHDVVIADMVIQGYQLDGINVHDLAERVELAELICRGNGRSGIAVVGASKVLIDNCLLGNNGRAQLWVEGPAAVDVTRSDLLDDGVPAVLVTGRGRVSVDGKPVPSPFERAERRTGSEQIE
jgi:hypothetical protein